MPLSDSCRRALTSPILLRTCAYATRGARAEHQRGADEERHDGERCQGQAPIQYEQEDDGAHKGERVGHERGDAVGDELIEGVDVVGQAADDPARLLSAEEVQRQLLQVREQLASQVVDDVFAHPARQVGLQVARAEVERAHGDERDNDPVQNRQVLVDDAVVDGLPDEVRDGKAAQRHDDHRHQAEDGAAPVGVGEAREPGELELARQVHERLPPLQLLQRGAAAVRAGGVTGGHGHQAPPSVAPARRPAARPSPSPSRP